MHKTATETLDVEELLRDDEMSFQINDEFDVCLHLHAKVEGEDEKQPILLFRKFNAVMHQSGGQQNIFIGDSILKKSNQDF